MAWLFAGNVVWAQSAPDLDADGYPAGEDCNDTDPAVHPGAAEVCNGTDDDCSAATSEAGTILAGAVSSYTSIQAAVSGSPAGTEIAVCDGTWVESVVIDRNVHLHGIGSVTVDGNDLGSVLTITAAGTVIEGFTIRNGTAAFGGGIHVDAGDVTLRDLVVVDNVGSYGGGIELFDPLTPVVLERITARNNVARVRGGGLDLYSGVATCTDCTLSGNRTDSRGGGVSVRTGSTLTLVRTTLADNAAGEGGGLDADGGSVVHLTDATVRNNTASTAAGGLRLTSATAHVTRGAFTRNSAPTAGGAQLRSAATLSASISNWGLPPDDNAPSDVASTAAVLGTFGVGASFTCTATSCTTQTVDLDADGYAATVDCNDADPTVYPGAPETCDGVDDDCDGAVDDAAVDAITVHVDGDADGYGDAGAALSGCATDPGVVVDASDCDDADPEVHPGADEVCNGLDDDCDPGTDEDEIDGATWLVDADADGFGAAAVTACEQPPGTTTVAGDCDDADAAVHPGAAEVCNDLDDDCDPATDEDAVAGATWYVDTDADGFGGAQVNACVQPVGTAAIAGDCDDAAAAVHPGAAETCNGVDDDCDPATDEDVVAGATWYVDTDGDGYGVAPIVACVQPAGTAALAGDCDDAVAATSPGAAETCNQVDDDCDGRVDADATDAVAVYADADADGYGDAAVAASGCPTDPGVVLNAADCDDTDPAVSPAGVEVCNGLDDDCDVGTDEDVVAGATWYVDGDADGFGDASTTACSQPAGTSAVGGDCDDVRAFVWPGAPETCNDRDDDCDGALDEDPTDPATFFADADLDGFGNAAVTTRACDVPAGFVTNAADCDDATALSRPGAPETCAAGDNDCDPATSDDDAADATTWYVDADGDQHGDPTATLRACTQPAGAVAAADDCDDTDPGTAPGGAERCDGVDNDCDPATGEPTQVVIGAVGYPTLTAAVTAAPTGGRIDVCGGTWAERLTLDRAVTVVGHGGPVIDANAGGSAIAVLADGVTLEGLTLTDGWAFFGGGLYVDGGGFVGRDLTLVDNVAVYGGGLALFDPPEPAVLDGLVATDNFAFSRGGGLDLYSGVATCTACSFDGNDAGDVGGAVSLRTGAELALIDGALSGNTARDGAGIEVGTGSLVVLSGATLDGNLADGKGGGLHVAGNADVQATDASVIGNGALAGGGAYLESGAGLAVTTSDWGAGATDNAPNDVGAAAGTIGTYGAGASFACDGVSCQ